MRIVAAHDRKGNCRPKAAFSFQVQVNSEIDDLVGIEEQVVNVDSVGYVAIKPRIPLIKAPKPAEGAYKNFTALVDKIVKVTDQRFVTAVSTSSGAFPGILSHGVPGSLSASITGGSHS